MIETIVPIPLEKLKLYFQDKTTKFALDYANSTLKGEKFLTYVSNLDVPADVKVDFASEEGRELLAVYLRAPNLVKLEALEQAAIAALFEARGFGDCGLPGFVEQNREALQSWLAVIDSLTLYNMNTIEAPEIKEFVQAFPKVDSTDIGLNFANLLKYEQTFVLLDGLVQENVKYYPTLFDNYTFKGQNLFAYWANPNNPMFILTTGIAAGQIKAGPQGESA